MEHKQLSEKEKGEIREVFNEKLRHYNLSVENAPGDKARIHCACGNVYITLVNGMTMTANPPIHKETASQPCPECGKLYEREIRNNEVREIYLGHKP